MSSEVETSGPLRQPAPPCSPRSLDKLGMTARQAPARTPNPRLSRNTVRRPFPSCFPANFLFSCRKSRFLAEKRNFSHKMDRTTSKTAHPGYAERPLGCFSSFQPASRPRKPLSGPIGPQINANARKWVPYLIPYFQI